MSDASNDPFIPIRDKTGKRTGIMDRLTADYLASKAPDPTQHSLDALLARITRVRIVTIAFRSGREGEQGILLDSSGPDTLASFRSCFAIVEDPATFGHCMCLGDPHMELWDGQELAATIGYHHGRSIRWDSWKHDALLKEPDRLLDWMTAHRVTGPRRAVEEMARRHEEQARLANKWLTTMPTCLHAFWDEMNRSPVMSRDLCKRMLDAFRAAVPDPTLQVLDLFAWFGSGCGLWSGYPSYESVPEQMLLGYPTELLVSAMSASTPTDPQWLGAARYFAGWEFERAKRKSDDKMLSQDFRLRLITVAQSTGINDIIMRAQSAMFRNVVFVKPNWSFTY